MPLSVNPESTIGPAGTLSAGGGGGSASRRGAEVLGFVADLRGASCIATGFRGAALFFAGRGAGGGEAGGLTNATSTGAGKGGAGRRGDGLAAISAMVA